MILESCKDSTNQPTDPGRFSDLDLLEREASYGRSQFTLQFQLDVSVRPDAVPAAGAGLDRAGGG